MALNTLSKLVGDIVGGHGLVSSRQEPRKTGRTYGTRGLTYPIDMGIDAPAELDNHVIFDIYIDDTTSFAMKKQTTEGEPRAFQGHTAIASQKIRNGLTNTGNDIKGALNKGVGLLGGGTAGKVAGAVVESTSNFTGAVFAGARNMKKLNSSIALAVPNTFVSTSSAQWADAKIGAMGGGIARLMEGGISGIKEKAQASSAGDLTQVGGEVARLALETAAKLPDAFGMNLQNILEVSTRRVSNPHVEQRFDSMNFRTFQFVYEFAARSQAEAQAIDNIIKTFRFHMHPELIESGLYFQYPSLFDISVMFKENDNPYMHKISTCVLTDFTTNYTSSGVFSTNRDGQPTEIQITMAFKEIEPLHKQRIAEGY
jgi:hypothetical protein